MKTSTITPNLTQLTRLRFVNAYLVREDDGFTLVDTTTGGAADDWSRRLAAQAGRFAGSRSRMGTATMSGRSTH